MLCGTQFSVFVSKVLGYFPGHIIGFGGKTGKQLIIDWGYQSRTGVYKINGADWDWEDGLRIINMPVLSISLKHDFMAPPQAMLHLCQKMKNASIDHVVLDIPSVNHFRWARKPSDIIDEINKWEQVVVCFLSAGR